MVSAFFIGLSFQDGKAIQVAEPAGKRQLPQQFLFHNEFNERGVWVYETGDEQNIKPRLMIGNHDIDIVATERCSVLITGDSDVEA